jgi:hypothetical protein
MPIGHATRQGAQRTVEPGATEIMAGPNSMDFIRTTLEVAR